MASSTSSVAGISRCWVVFSRRTHTPPGTTSGGFTDVPGPRSSAVGCTTSKTGTVIDGEPAADRYPIHGDLLDSTALSETMDRVDTALLPQAYPDGSPTHPSYPGGHAVTAGSNATILKAYFDGDAEITNPVRPDPEDPTSLTTEGTPDTLTVRGEINKLAANVSYARSWAGIHYRSDTTAGLRVGERVAAAVLSERLRQRSASAYGSRGEFDFTTFDGTEVTVTADGVSPASAFDPPLFRSEE